MAPSIDELVKTLTEEEVLEAFLGILESIGIPARSWRVGGSLRSILRVVARTYAGFTELQSAAIKAGFLESAFGPWLTLLAYYVFGVERPDATFATGFERFTNTGGGSFSYGPDEVTLLWEAGKRSYVNAEAFTLGPLESKLVAIRAVEAGAASSAAPGSITKLETTMIGVVVTNEASVVGADALKDPDLRQKCRDKRASRSPRGPRGAYAFAVSEAKRIDGTPVNINRNSVSKSSSTGTVTVYVASPSGAPIAEDIAAVVESIEAIARPDTVTVFVLAATEVPLSRSLVVWARRVDGVSASDIKALVESALLAEIATYPIGGIPKPPLVQGYLYADFISGIAKGSHPSIFDVDGAGSDQALAPGEVVTMTTTVEVRVVDVS